VAIIARDAHRSIEFYRQLGLPVPEPGGPEGRTRTSTWSFPVAIGSRSTPSRPSLACIRIGLLSDCAGRVALAFGLDSPAEVDTTFERLTKAGHPGPLEPYDAPWGQRYATVLDPDGNMVDLFALLAS
jgi:catechol 2,3-dioxygenase-like lactoylglutathione lyase family enzyme